MNTNGMAIRLIFIISLAAGVCLKAEAANETANEAAKKPNFLIIITDDQRWDAAGYAGNPIIQTPNMDRLAAKGSWFTNAFVTTPICAASRASILTGMYERSHAYTFNTPPLREELVDISYPAVLKDAGYNLGYIGKLGVNFEDNLDTTLFDYYRRQDWGQFYYRLTADGHSHRHVTDMKGDQAIEYLETRSGDEPFCLTLSFNAPHAEDQSVRQFIWPVELDSLYVDDVIPAPVMGEDHWFGAQPDFVQNGMNRIRWNWRFDTEEKYQHMVKAYYRMITGVDRVMGRVFNELEARGLDENTIVIFIGDNGFFLGERGFAGKWLMYEPSMHVPMIIYNPLDKESQGRKIDKLALNIDLAPTIYSCAGIGIPGAVQGEDLNPVLRGEGENWRSDFFCEHLFDHRDIPQSEGIRSTEWKYFRYRDFPGHEELYRLTTDPWERQNLAGDKAYGKELDALRKRCDDMIGTLSLDAGTGDGSDKKEAKQKYVSFKLDDLGYKNWREWKIVTDLIIEKDITGDVGIFVQSLLLGDEDYLAYVQSLVDDPKHFQLWFHGWTGTPKEFREADYETQLEHFYLGRTTMLKKVDYILRTYSPHWYGENEHTPVIVNEDPFLKGVIYTTGKAYSKEKQGLAPAYMRMEPATGVLSHELFLDNWDKYQADTLPYIVLQGHAWGYTTHAQRSELADIADDLLDKGYTFTHVEDYRRMIRGYSADSTAPSVPANLVFTRIDDARVRLDWDPSVDEESGVDCYKIYRDGICIDLSATTSYTDSVAGSHHYQVAAVNNNDIVSARSGGSMDLPRGSAKAENVALKGIEKYLSAVEKDGQELHSLMVLRHGRVVYEAWFGDHAAHKKHVMHSVSKAFTSMGLGFAVQEGLLAVDDKVVSFFPGDLPEECSPRLLDLEIRDLLTMTVGHDSLSTMEIRSQDGSWEKLFLARPFAYEPGTVFAYNSMATYMLSAIVQKVSGTTLLEYLKPRLLDPLRIYGAEWLESPTGINAGGWGLYIKTEDMAKLGLFMLQKGKWEGKQLLTAQWIEEASSVKVKQRPFWVSAGADLDESDWGQGYGYQLWRNRPGGFRADGARGQYIIVLPEKDAVIATTANNSDTQAQLDLIWEYIFPAIR